MRFVPISDNVTLGLRFSHNCCMIRDCSVGKLAQEYVG